MPVQTFAELFSLGTGAAATTVARTGYGFQPKAAIFSFAGTVTTGAAGADPRFGYGFAVSASERASTALFVDDGVATSNVVASHRTDALIEIVGPTQSGRFDLQSFDAGGLTLVVDLQATFSMSAGVFAIGGTDITNAKIVTFQEHTSTGSQAITGVGFQPDIVFFMSTHDPTVANSIKDTGTLMFGAATATDSACTDLGILDAVAANNAANSYIRRGHCIAMIAPAATPSMTARASLESMDSDGFHLWWDEQTAAGRYIHALCIKGGVWKVGGFDAPTTSAATHAETGFGATVKGLVMAGMPRVEDADDTVAEADAYLAFGAASSTSARWGVSLAYDFDADGSIGARAADTIGMIVLTPPTSGGERGVLDLASFDADGFTVAQDDTDALTPLFVWYAGVMDSPSAARTRVRTYAYG